MASALLVLEDGRVFRGEAFGASGTVCGEICFTTTMTGYQETLTDPSFRGQIVAMTAPMIGNTGVNGLDGESEVPHVRGFVLEELSPMVSSWRAEGNLADWLAEHGVVGIEDVDTRALTRHLRERGAMTACLSTELSEQEALERARADVGVVDQDFVKEVCCDEVYQWDPEGERSQRWRVENPALEAGELVRRDGECWQPLPQTTHRVVAYDLGVKENILRELRAAGFEVHVVPATTTAQQVMELNPDGVFLSNGPGDPSALGYVHEELSKLIGEVPIFGICLGHQMLAHALGGSTFKLKFGHRGGNQPVQDVRTGKVAITSQNHGFAVDGDSLPDEVEVTHVNLNDGTCEGLRHKSLPVFSVQYHPEAAPGPHDARYLFEEFAQLMGAQA